MEGVSGRFVGPAHPDRLRHNVLATGCAAYIYRTAHNNSAWRLQYTCVAVNKRAWVRTKQHKGEGKQAAGPTMRVWCGRGEKREGWADRRWRLWQPPSIILRDTVRKGACPLGCAPLQGSEQGRGGLWVVQAHTQICPGGPEAEVPPLLHRKLHGSMGPWGGGGGTRVITRWSGFGGGMGLGAVRGLPPAQRKGEGGGAGEGKGVGMCKAVRKSGPSNSHTGHPAQHKHTPGLVSLGPPRCAHCAGPAPPRCCRGRPQRRGWDWGGRAGDGPAADKEERGHTKGLQHTVTGRWWRESALAVGWRCHTLMSYSRRPSSDSRVHNETHLGDPSPGVGGHLPCRPHSAHEGCPPQGGASVGVAAGIKQGLRRGERGGKRGD
jgi:hypothetical protein